jgi:hypothetical protein
LRSGQAARRSALAASDRDGTMLSISERAARTMSSRSVVCTYSNRRSHCGPLVTEVAGDERFGVVRSDDDDVPLAGEPPVGLER